MGFLLFLSACANKNKEVVQVKPIEGIEIKSSTMTVEIWSDFACPFCYIGKRKFESALAKFKFDGEIDIVWKSYQLNPDQITNPEKNAIQSLAEAKGISFEEANNMSNYVTDMAKTVGLNYDFQKTVTANTRNAHRLSHLAKTIGKQQEAEELLFEAYFLNGKNIADIKVLQEIGEKIGLDANRIAKMLESNEFNDAVDTDIYESRQLGVQGVPFFVINKKYGISGAQDSEVFLKTLEKARAELNK